MAGPEGGERRGGGGAAAETPGGGVVGRVSRGATADGGDRGGFSSSLSARGTSGSPASRTFTLAGGRGRSVVSAAKGSIVADDRGGATLALEYSKHTSQIGSSGPLSVTAGTAVDRGVSAPGKRAAGSPSARRTVPGSEDDMLISSRIAAIAQQLEWAATTSSPDSAAETSVAGAPQQPPAAAAGAAPGTTESPTTAAQEDFALEVNGCFQKMYSGVYSVDLVVALLQSLSQAPLGGRDSSLFLAMLRTLFFECRHFPRYPTHELLLTAELFGKLIASQVLLHHPNASGNAAGTATNASSLVIALRCVVEALRKGPNSKMFLFGVAALEQVLRRLYLFPEFLVSLSRLPPHFNLQCPHYTAYIETLLMLIPERLHRCVYLDPAAAAAALPAIPDPPATRGPGASNLTPAITAAASAPPPAAAAGAAVAAPLAGGGDGGIVACALPQQQQQPHMQQGYPLSPNASSAATRAAAGCVDASKAAPGGVAALKAGDGGSDGGGAAAGGGGVSELQEQQRRQHLQAAGLLPQQQQQHGGKGTPQQGGVAAPPEVGSGGGGVSSALLGSGGGGGAAAAGGIGVRGATATGGEKTAGGRGMMLLGGDDLRPFFAAGTAAPLGTVAGLGSGVMVAAAAAKQGLAGQPSPYTEQGAPGLSNSGSSGGGGVATTAAVLQQQQQVAAGGDLNNIVLGGVGGVGVGGGGVGVRGGMGLTAATAPPPTAIGALLQGVGLGQVEGLMNDRELLAKLVLPPQWLAEQVIAACNTVCEANVDDKAAAMRHVLTPEYQAWLAFYLVKSRASKEPNLHAIFFLFVEKLEMPGLPEVVINMTYDCINTLLKYVEEAKESSSYRTLLKNLGLWLGRITLARNRPLMSKRLDLKALLFRGYDEGHLVAVLPLVCKVLEAIKSSKVFKPPNPWTTAMLSLLAELQQLSTLRTTLIFEVEVLFKNLHINVQDYHGRSHHLDRRPVPTASSDFAIRTTGSPLDPTGTVAAASAAAAASGGKSLGASLSLSGVAANAASSSTLLPTGPPPGMVGPPGALGAAVAAAAAAAQQQQAATGVSPATAAAAGGGGAGLPLPAATAAGRATAAATPAAAAAEDGVAAGGVCSRLLLAVAAGNAAAAQKLQQQQQRGLTTAAGGQLLEAHHAAGDRFGIDVVTANLRTAAAAGGGEGERVTAAAAADQLQMRQQHQMLAAAAQQQQQQLLVQHQPFPQLQQQQQQGGAAAAEATAAAAAAAAALRGAPRVAEVTLLQHHQRLLAAAAAAAGNGSARDGLPMAQEQESIAAGMGGRRDPRSLLLAAAARGGGGSSDASASSVFVGGGASYAQQQQQHTAMDRASFVAAATYPVASQGSSLPQAWSSLPQEQQGGEGGAGAVVPGGSASLLKLMQQQQPQQQQQTVSVRGDDSLLEQQQQPQSLGVSHSPPPPTAQKSTAPCAAAAAAAQGSSFRPSARPSSASGGSSSSVGGGDGLTAAAVAIGGSSNSSGSPPLLFGGGTAAAEAFAAGGASSSLMPSDSLLQNLAQNVVISPSIALLSLQPGLRPLIPLAVERAVREIISAVAERSVTISCVTTRELVCKDFCMEGEESLIKRAAHLMVASLAGSLALVTCREPLRASLTQHLRQLLQPVASTPECGDQVLVEQVLQIVSADNLDLGCSAIEQAVVEKVLRDIEISIQPALLLRRQAKERGISFVDTQYISGSRWPMALPEPLKLHPLLDTRQLQVYKDFMLMGPLRKMQQHHLYSSSSSATVTATTQQQQQLQQQQQQQQRSNGSQHLGGASQQQQQHQHEGGAAGEAGAEAAAAAAGGTAGGAGATSTGGGGGRDGTEGGGVGGGSLLPGGTATAAATASSTTGKLSAASQQQQQQREAIQQMAATVAAARALSQQQQQQKLLLLQQQQQGLPPPGLPPPSDLDSLTHVSRQQAFGAAAMLGAAAGGASPQQQARPSLGGGLHQSSYGASTSGLSTPHHPPLNYQPGQEQSLSVLMLRLEGCLVQLRDVVRDIFSSPPVMPTPSTAHRFSHPAGCQMQAVVVPPCSTSALLVFACLPSNHELFQLIASVSSVASSCPRMDEVAPALAHKLIKSVFEGAALAAHRGVTGGGTALRGVDPTGLYMEVFFAVLAALRRESDVVGKLAGEVLLISCASATQPPKKSNVAVAAGLMRYGLVDYTAFDGVLAGHIMLEGGCCNAPVMEFVLVLLKVLYDQHAITPAALPSTFKALATADADTSPLRLVQLRGWQTLSLSEARDKLLQAFRERDLQEEKKKGDNAPQYVTTLAQLMAEYSIPAFPVKVRCLPVLPDICADDQQLIRRIFEDWVRLCSVPGSFFSSSSSAAAGEGGAGGKGFSWMAPGTQQQQPTAVAADLFAHRRDTSSSDADEDRGERGGGRGGSGGVAALAAGGGGGGQQQQQGPQPSLSGSSGPGGAPAAAWGEEDALLLRAVFFQEVSQQGLLRMDEDTDRFFAVCVQVAVEKATRMLRTQAVRSSSGNHALAVASSAAAAKDASAAGFSRGESAGTPAAAAAASTSCSCAAASEKKGDRVRKSSSSSSAETAAASQQAEEQEKGGGERQQAQEEERTGARLEKIAFGELEGSSSGSNQGQRTGSTLSSSGSGTTAAAADLKGAAAAAAAELWHSEASKSVGGAGEERKQRKEAKSLQEQQEKSSSKKQQGGEAAVARRESEGVEGAEDDGEGGESEQQKTVGILEVDPSMSAETLAAMETPPVQTEAPLDATPLDALAKMVAAMMRFVDAQQVSPVLILQRALGVICRHMHMEAEALASSFNQRPYFRLLLAILLEVTSPAAFPHIGVSLGAAAAAGGGVQQQQQRVHSSSTSSTPEGSEYGGSSTAASGDTTTAALAQQQQLLLQQSILSFADHLALLSPLRLPAFAFAWLELVGHRTFLPLLLRGTGALRGAPRSGWTALHKLLLLHFEFLHPFLASVSLSDSVRQLYKGTLRVLLVLLHDFPEYLCETYFDCCSVLPLNCVQLRNVILSAFPRNMRLPDPFLPNLRVDLLPEVKMVPRLLLTHSFYSVLLLHQRQQHLLLKRDVDLYWQTREPLLLPRIRKKLLLPSKAEALKKGTKYDLPLFNSFLLYVATSVPDHDPRNSSSISCAILPPGPLPPAFDSSSNNGTAGAAAGGGNGGGERGLSCYSEGGGFGSGESFGGNASSLGYGCNSIYRLHFGGDSSNGFGPDGNGLLLNPALDIILYLAKELDMEGRYLLMSAIANHLRYPNAHTHFFSNVLLWLFSESKEELVQEQITRVLLERLIVHRPHPWGLLITFIELIKNPRFAFWSCLFVSAAPEVEKLFQSVAHTCLGQSGAQQLQQQRQR